MKMVHAEDARLFREVQAVVAELPPVEGQDDERRGSNRDAFVTLQYIAPYDGQEMPHQTDLRLVPFLDISANGFSFVVRDKPQFEQLIVMLGKVPMRAFTAKVRNVVEMSGGEGLYKVGCQLEGRL